MLLLLMPLNEMHITLSVPEILGCLSCVRLTQLHVDELLPSSLVEQPWVFATEASERTRKDCFERNTLYLVQLSRRVVEPASSYLFSLSCRKSNTRIDDDHVCQLCCR